MPVSRLSSGARFLALSALVLAVLAALVPATSNALPPASQFYAMNSINYLGDPTEPPEFQYLGVQKARIGLSWNAAKTGSCSTFNPKAHDAVVLAAAEHGITLVPILTGNCPEGGQTEHAFPTPATSQYSVWLQFVTTMVKRYGPGGELWAEHPGVTPHPIQVWEAWNEPNVVRNNPSPAGIYPERFANFLVDTSAAIKAISPGATVLVGGLAVAGWQIPTGSTAAPSALSFLNSMYNNAPASGPEAYSPAELKAAFDGLAIHPYALNGNSGDSLKQVEEARSALNNDAAPGGGDDAKSLAITELGWPIKGEGGITVGVSEIQQADALWGAFSELRNKAEAWNILYATWWENRDGNNGTWEHYSGLKRANGELRMSYCALSYLTETSRCLYQPGGYPTTAYVSVSNVLHGQPGYVTVSGSVTSTPGAFSLAGRSVRVNYQKKVGGEWQTINTIEPTINAESKYSIPNLGVGVGEWRVRTRFIEQRAFQESEFTPYHYFTIRSGYQLIARHSGKCMAVTSNSTAEGAAILQWNCTAGTNPADGYTFTFAPREGGWYQIRVNPRIGIEQIAPKCLDVTGASTANGAKLQQYTCLGESQPNQLWQVIPIAGQPPYVAFAAKHSGRCADVEGVSTANGALIQQWDCLWSGNQQWVMQPVG